MQRKRRRTSTPAFLHIGERRWRERMSILFHLWRCCRGIHAERVMMMVVTMMMVIATMMAGMGMMMVMIQIIVDVRF